jgi:hypothetical protein
MIWLSQIIRGLSSHCDAPLVRVQIFSFSDRIGRLAMKVQADHLSVRRSRFHWMRSRGNEPVAKVHDLGLVR